MSDLQQMAEEDLWTALTQASGRERIDVLFELANRASGRRDHDRALTLWQEVESTAAQLGDVGQAATAMRLQGAACFSAGDAQAAVETYQRAAAAYGEAGMSRDAASVLWCLADCYRVLGDVEAQLSAAVQSRELAQFEGEHTVAGDACFLQARALYLLNRDEEALVVCRAGRDHFRAAERPDLVAVVDDFAVSVHLFLGNLDEALELARGCLVLANVSSSTADDRYARYRLAEVFLRRGEAEQALGQADQALTAYRQADDFVGAARCEQLRAEAFFEREDLPAALEAFANAWVLFDATGRETEGLRCDTRRAVALHYAGDYRQAARINERLVQAFGQVGDQPAVRWSVVRWLDNLRQDQQFEQCRQIAQDHAGLWPPDATAEDASYREFLGVSSLALEQIGHVDRATEIASQVIAQTPAREASPGTAYCYEVRGRSRLDSDEPGAGQDFSHAIALHLVQGNIDRARELSQYFLPANDSLRKHAGDEVPVSPEHG